MKLTVNQQIQNTISLVQHRTQWRPSETANICTQLIVEDCCLLGCNGEQ